MGLTNNRTFFTVALAAFAVAVLPEIAHALSFDPSGIIGSAKITNGLFKGTGFGPEAGGIAKALCEIVGWFQGGVGQSIASLAIIFLGISAFFGKVTWGTALLFAVGVFAIFGSGEIISAITSGKANGCCGGTNVSVVVGGIGAKGCASF